jgi:hypothetical protein
MSQKNGVSVVSSERLSWLQRMCVSHFNWPENLRPQIWKKYWDLVSENLRPCVEN